ncbi:hypothetical protein SERLA73DRAFT_191301 [Serpula lacrymans var. lacrymans S7.3]|uniref:Uncharacterized protein n=1 Tax=Serpula lacrymans var. lacrymans (strain S7.3) TaxID=936435 RepID=F8QH92_SERL3|nr:hypothetical protein SERLA73DRAFT_191301 [Serpula lacrymans var. lacrymans S7.3]
MEEKRKERRRKKESRTYGLTALRDAIEVGSLPPSCPILFGSGLSIGPRTCTLESWRHGGASSVPVEFFFAGGALVVYCAGMDTRGEGSDSYYAHDTL